ncbi:histidine kinase dimerization/phosphoacceptor domain -containing protein [Xanthobacter sp. YC-JY1]|uniref:histidine kinase dimerization/phosphoacceptor domain -containing protein n=1 Tax=Xanthobacter sp. YC-JY1 TaxID=2419844 RepID=UPI001F157A9C|nr:histidine kinase dimerization/phosphoacceptor domain -containing protein [Xanthobacter sp. YC-JY1]UJX44095.1 GAF domain-containing protein [Xanthobacter sp. YC-JY1]
MNQSVPRSLEDGLATPVPRGRMAAPGEAALDQIVGLAALLCEAPMSVFTLVDDDHPQGTSLGFGFAPHEVPSDMALFAEAVQQGGILIVPDLTQDPRFNTLACVTRAPFLRSYAGVPLEMSEGQGAGTLCVVGHSPRDLTPVQRLALQSLARHASTELGLRRSLDAERAARIEVARLLSERNDLLARNDVLRREADHRVKNSLQLVAAMLGLQARRLSDASAAKALEDAQQRIGGIAAVHEQLYRSSGTDLVEVSDFVEGLCAALAANRPANVDALRVHADKLTLESSQAMNLGLLLSELVTNAFKHAYAAGTRGDVRVVLTADDRWIELVVSDDGAGLPAGFSPEGGTGLGMRLVRAVLGEFGGAITAKTGTGATFAIKMPVTLATG